MTLVEQLRFYARQMGPTGLGDRCHLSADKAPMLKQAADEIEKLQAALAKRPTDADVEKVAAALRDSMPGLVNPEIWPWVTMARAALTASRTCAP